jgi:hypothetical protein
VVKLTIIKIWRKIFMKKVLKKKRILSIMVIVMMLMTFADVGNASEVSSPVFTMNIGFTGLTTHYDSVNSRAVSTIKIDADVLRDGLNAGTPIDKWEVDIKRVNSSGVEIGTEFTVTEVISSNVTNVLIYERVIHTPQSLITSMGNPDSLYFKFSVRAYLAPQSFPPGLSYILPENGNTTAGFYGFVPSSEFITGNALATMIGLTAGISQNSDAGWLKFSSNGKTLYVAMKTFKHTISWDQINSVSAVYGNRTVAINGNLYKIRLLTGGNADPASSAGGEWNSLMYGVHMSTNPQWGPGYSNADLNVGTGNGLASWVQEKANSSSSNRVLRGNPDVSTFGNYISSGATTGSGWRPVLELVD